MLRQSFNFFSCIILIFVAVSQAQAQYFYKDIWSTQQMIKEFASLKNENIKSVIIKSFEDDGQPSEGFFCERKMDKNFNRSELVSRSYITAPSFLTTYYNDKGWVTRTIDSTSETVNRSDYEYDAKGRITLISNFTRAGEEKTGITENRQYFYDATGRAQKMLRKKNNTEVATVNFTLDEKGNVVDEQEIIKGRNGKKYFYYYDVKNRLTDVVHYNKLAKRMLPDYMYEYNQLNQATQMITAEDGVNNYFIWKYTYNDQRLKETEKCFSKERRLLGTIQYQYK